ncbi:MFS transporter [Amaricoccus solimangrovi]|uniref:MFS transporter n=1 Tax=Amaricoccus solimangrovi TaxID=2589815 RepID=A0A501WPK9_9RHOB|nr:MFS transporter [Amaricoccus solimangrovi]TPE51389.1 MFS transporter [Amaricoccus solimangrovi]
MEDTSRDGAAPPPSALGPFRHPTFREIWMASLVSNLGGLIQTVGAAWMMTSLTSQADMVALVQASTTLPIMVFSLTAGAIADNFDRRGVMIIAQVFMCLVSLGLAAVAWVDGLTPWLLLGFTFLIGAGTALNNPAWQASVGDLVPRADLPAAVVLNSVGFNITRSVGPAIGGAIVAAGGGAAAFAANALSYFPLLLVLARWKPRRERNTLPRETIGMAMGAGLRYVAMSPNIGKVLLRGFVFGLGAISVQALLPVVARDLVAGGPLTYGLLLGAFGVGALGGAYLAAPLRARLSSEAIVRLGFLAFAICAAVVGLSRMSWLTGLGLLLGGASWVLSLSTFNVTVQLSTPRWVVARALALYQTATFGGMAIGSWIWGVLAERTDPTTALLATAGALLAGGAIGFRFRLPDRAELNLDPLNRWRMPEIEIDLKPRSGPMAIVIEYIIRPEDEADFLDAMIDRRRIRRRDGARHWTLMRDIGDARVWIETYQTPTWIEYMRHNQRITHADAVIGERLRALHAGEAPPRVRRMVVRQVARTHEDPHHLSGTETHAH